MIGKDDFWVLARQSAGLIDPISFEVIAWARELLGDRATITTVLCGPVLSDLELAPLAWHGADRIVALESNVSEIDIGYWTTALALVFECEGVPGAILAGADSYGRAFMPYLAMKLHTGLTADCTQLEWDSSTGSLLQTRPATGGNIMATICCKTHRPQLATVRPRSRKPQKLRFPRNCTLARFNPSKLTNIKAGKQVVLESFLPASQSTSIQDADKIVAVGRGIKRPENLPMIYRLADLLGAKVGASREVVDRGWIPWSNQIGLSGKTVVPRLYVAIGISGAIQHLAGMQTAQTIVAVNRDADAPVFKVADFGIVGDLMEVVPAWIARLEKGKK